MASVYCPNQSSSVGVGSVLSWSDHRGDRGVSWPDLRCQLLRRRRRSCQSVFVGFLAVAVQAAAAADLEAGTSWQDDSSAAGIEGASRRAAKKTRACCFLWSMSAAAAAVSSGGAVEWIFCCGEPKPARVLSLVGFGEGKGGAALGGLLAMARRVIGREVGVRHGEGGGEEGSIVIPM